MANIFATRKTGKGGDAFLLRILEEDGRAVEVTLTPEQWALAMWSRGDIFVEAEWTDASTISAATAALNFLTDFTNTEGAHHKAWLVDQAIRALMGPERYQHWRAELGEEYDEGVAP